MHHEHEEHKKHHKTHHKEHHITHKPRRIKKKNLWMWASIVLAVLLVISIYTSGFKFSGDSGTFTKDEASEKALDYINNYLLQGTTATLNSVEEDSGMYVLKIRVQEREFESYVSKDGKLLFPQVVDMTQEPEIQEASEVQTVETADSEEITEFVGCLKEADFKIYGANWCGWTQKLVTTFGGFDAVGPIYVECTEEKELCSEAGVESFPTIIIGGERHTGERTFDSFADATGCEVPLSTEVTESPSTDTASCG